MALEITRTVTITRLLGAASLLALAGVAAPAWAQESAQEASDPAAQTQPTGSEDVGEQAADAAQEDSGIVVTGFRRSLAEALEVKRDSVAAVDAIVAEDIAKFPDQNLAESLQRIPGISIQREGGEGRTITVRGLGAQFTRVRVNGLETVATSTEGAAANRDRAFDFNVFASELFNSIVVHKTAEASLDEGSLGAVVDLNTGNPLGGKRGLTLVASAQASYNDLSDDVGPRLAGLVSWKNQAGTFGVAVSAAYQENKTLELGNNTVRWQQSRFDSVAGVPCFFTSATSTTPAPNAGGVYRQSAGCNAVALAFHPRIPRYSEVGHDRERLGLTGSVQWAPSDATKVSVDGLFSRFKEDREEKHGEILFRNNERFIDVAAFEIDPATNNLVSGTFNDVYVRTEHYLRRSKTDFYQLGATWDQDLSDSLRFTLLGGFSKSDADIPIETSLMFDDRDATGYSYDYSDSRHPLLTFGTSVTDPAVFQLAEIRDRPSNVTNRFRTLSLRGEWDVADGLQFAGGGVYRRFQFDTTAFLRDTLVCPSRPAAAPDVVLGTITCTPSNVFGANAVYGFPAGNLGEIWDLGASGQPGGNTNSFLIPNLEAATAFTKLYERPLLSDVGNNRAVVEKVTGGYFEARAKGEIAGVRYAANAGIRYVKTDQSSTGIINGTTEVTVERSYEDFLPALNLAIFPTENLILRAAVADVITRPTLGQLTPGGSVDAFNFRVNFGNPFLEPYRATAYDLALEWYFAPQAIASVAVFKKDIASFPISVTRNGTFAETGLPLSILPSGSPAAASPNAPFQISTIENGTGASLKGIEFQLQAPFRFLPGFLKNMGGIANVTLVDSDATYTVSTAATNPATLALGSAARAATLFGLSKRAFNGTLYYEDDRFSARVSASYRSKFLENASATGNQFEGFNSTINVDASLRYRITDRIELSLEGINLTDDFRDRFTDVDANRNYEYNHFGRTIQVGARFKM
ncbi:TonB-dependent receptor [Sphingomonas parva]|uniref:TonB-dependent receptor n=2 Tax=Sphingomonas parva TaxID=2555898 RepID=A0A4Y8ZNQ7_9SPHN|nr:TonB-dependent receptor [Sphingomonas parva]TFI56902.1 TonB-dependent receptor [Sphingomonas parva]